MPRLLLPFSDTLGPFHRHTAHARDNSGSRMHESSANSSDGLTWTFEIIPLMVSYKPKIPPLDFPLSN